MITEPEAASLYTLMSVKDKGLQVGYVLLPVHSAPPSGTNPAGITKLITRVLTRPQRGDAMVVCDAGGGTVDLVSYEIQSMDPFELKALTAPSGTQTRNSPQLLTA